MRIVHTASWRMRRSPATETKSSPDPPAPLRRVEAPACLQAASSELGQRTLAPSPRLQRCKTMAVSRSGSNALISFPSMAIRVDESSPAGHPRLRSRVLQVGTIHSVCDGPRHHPIPSGQLPRSPRRAQLAVLRLRPGYAICVCHKAAADVEVRAVYDDESVFSAGVAGRVNTGYVVGRMTPDSRCMKLAASASPRARNRGPR